MGPGVGSHGIKADPPGYLWSKFERFLSSDWSGYELLKKLHIKLQCSVTGKGTTRVTTIALLALRTDKLKTK